MKEMQAAHPKKVKNCSDVYSKPSVKSSGLKFELFEQKLVQKKG